MDPDEFDRQWRTSTRRPDPGQDPMIVEGRPLTSERGPVFAAVSRVGSWASAQEPLGVDLDDAQRARVQAHWLASALAEHASVASFSRAALELMAVAAPAALVHEHLAAAQDELRHASVCFSIAAAYGAPASGPGPLASPSVRGGGLERVVRDVFREGCVNETIAALLARRASGRAETAALRVALERIADDEAGHAALAWKTLRWALEQEPRLAAAVRAELARELRRSAAPESDDGELAMHGVLGAGAIAEAREQALESLIAPLVEELAPRAVS